MAQLGCGLDAHQTIVVLSTAELHLRTSCTELSGTIVTSTIDVLDRESTGIAMSRGLESGIERDTQRVLVEARYWGCVTS